MIKFWVATLVVGIFSFPVVAEQGAALEFEDVWIRAMPPFQRNSAAYLTLTNTGDTAIAIVGGSTEVAEKAELHTTRKVDGMIRMEQLNGLALAPGERVELVPGGAHLMLFGLLYRPIPGDEIKLCLQLVSGEEVCTVAEVRKSADEKTPQDHRHH